MQRRQFISTLIGFSFLSSISRVQAASQKQTKLIIYSGVTMAKAISEIAELFKKQHKDVDIVIMRGGSKDLYDTLSASRAGDLYLPGEPTYILENTAENLFIHSVEVGYNQAVLLVAKGNPKEVKPELTELLRSDLATVLSTPEQGAIGLETQLILDKQVNANFYTQAVAHARALMSDGRSLTQAIARGEADVCLNWRAGVSFAPDAVEAIDLPDSVAPRRQLLLTKLSFTQHEQLVDQFMQFALSNPGQTVMRRYGF